MSYTAMTTRPVGYIVPASEWNQIVTNFAAVFPYAAAGDIAYATAADTLGALGIGNAGQALRVNAGGTAPEWRGGYSVIVTRSASLTVADSTITDVLWDTEIHDPDAMHNTGANTDRLVAPVNGIYLAALFGAFATNATGYRIFEIQDDGGVVWSEINRPGNSVADIYENLSIPVLLNANGWVKARVWQNSGGNLIFLRSAINKLPSFSLTLLKAI